MSKTTIIIFHIDEKYSIGFHQCVGAPEIYFQQSAGNIYEYLVRKNKITNKCATIDIVINNITMELVHVVPNGDYIEKWNKHLTLDQFLKAKIDEIDVVHEKYKIKHYLPKPSTEFDKETINEYYEIYKLLNKNNTSNEIHNVKCLIWKHLKDEERLKRNAEFEN